jgi:bifunctional UDP-N-acetylglucosamine pyrophosphorylase/glucosamine-1-phosphate N-acetyltransferase
MGNFSVVILAAGVGTRMQSSLPKVMQKLSGRPLLEWVINSVSVLRPDNIIVVLGYGSKVIERYFSNYDVKFVFQKKQLGSAHAVKQAAKILKNYVGDVLVMSGDVPLINSSTLLSLIRSNKKTRSAVTVLAGEVKDPFGYGRIIKNGDIVDRIVEETDANLAEKKVKCINSGIYCFDKNLWKSLSKVKPKNVKKEYYITDTIAVLKKFKKKISLVVVNDEYEIKGINNRLELFQAEVILKKKKVKELFNSGVSILDIENVYISYDAKIGSDTVIYPGVFVGRDVSIGKKCVIRGASYIIDSKIGDETVISYSYIDGAVIDRNVEVGPFAHIRPGSILKENVKIGNFSETKKAVIAKNSKVSHLSYMGDVQIGENVNIGAGTIICNYDGVKKHRTVIGSKSFIGSNVNLIAPVKIGRDVLVAAGSTITYDVPPGKMAIARARQELRHKKKFKKL